jgi:hypothetical protein
VKWRRPGPFKGAWSKVHPQPPAVAVPQYKPTKIMKLNAFNEFHSGTALFERKDGFWKCFSWDKCLFFLKGKDMPSAKMDLLRRGFTFNWENFK